MSPKRHPCSSVNAGKPPDEDSARPWMSRSVRPRHIRARPLPQFAPDGRAPTRPAARLVGGANAVAGCAGSYAYSGRFKLMRVFLDDERQTPAGWRRVHWPDQAIALLETGEVAELSLDHDLGDDARGTGYDVIVWIERAVIERGFHPPAIRVHSANPAARLRMQAGIEAVSRAWVVVQAADSRSDG
ncbi:cyclic-phosphate processing receiver domain-containing protein [Lysobacter sp. CA199]|uniref:cyclic-phosphate processing receiver domain-containing protein n=1 Tax=Lysobacter sp. CA199 TaxID=3455608 RepID=UPI003F8D6285